MKTTKKTRLVLSLLTVVAMLLSVLSVGMFALADDQWTIDTTLEGAADVSATSFSCSKYIKNFSYQFKPVFRNLL